MRKAGRHTLHALAFVGALAVAPLSGAAVPTDWASTPYAYEAQQTPIDRVLKAFAQTFGLKLRLDGTLSGNVDGKLRTDTPQAFLQRLALEHRFQWFLYNNTLYVSPIDQEDAARLEVSPDAVPDLKKALGDIGLLDSRFGWGELPDEGVVLVSGPARYVRLVRQFAREREKPEEKQEVISIDLRYASAADRSIRYREESLTIPGVASILRGLLEARSNAPAMALGNGSPGQVMQGLQGLQNGAMGQIEQLAIGLGRGAPNQNRLPVSTSGGGRIRVEADVRNNAVLVYDSPKRRSIYEPLIRSLDVPRKLVEIDAIILDIDRTQLAELAANWNVQHGEFAAGASLLQGGTSTLFIQNYGDFFAQLRALEGRGLASVVANPSVLTLENQPAVIDFSHTEYLRAVGERVATFQPITAGTSLQVVPHTIEGSQGDQIQLVVDIEDGRIEAPTAGQDTPSVRRGTVSTQAVMGEKRSLVVGGFHVEETGDNTERVPVLGRIPVLGKLLFTSTNRQTNRRERVFILTPRLIGDQVDPARYLPESDRHQVDAAMARVDERHGGHRPVGREEVGRILADVVVGRIPKGFSQSASVPYMPASLCRLPAPLTLDASRAQWLAGADYGVAVGVVRNTGDRRLRLDEADCGGPRSLAVTAWPKAWLDPGEETEVFVAMRPPSATTRARTSLLEGGRAP